MKNKSKSTLFLLIISFFITLMSTNLIAETNQNYGHISYLDKQATVIHQDGSETRGMVNIPLLPGDTIITSEKDRCEIQFDNGTIIRLGKNSLLKITTIQAPSLTSKWKITTLYLEKGRLCSMNRSYDKEMFQITTPNTAIELKKSTTTYINLKENGDTHVYTTRGKSRLLYGQNLKNIKTEILGNHKGFTVTADHQLFVGDMEKDSEFFIWNDYVNRNFKELHFGISKVPRKLYRFNKALTYWAERWSSLFGEWIYNDLFGYVWKPADEQFAYRQRPFIHANWIWINGQLFLVPQQSWGWIPAHMGTWVWTKTGWVWIPGSVFRDAGLTTDLWWRFGSYYPFSPFHPYFTYGYYPRYNYPVATLGNLISQKYGGIDLFIIFRRYGIEAWRDAYFKQYGYYKNYPVHKDSPKSIKKLFKKLNRAPIKLIKEHLVKEPVYKTGISKIIRPVKKSDIRLSSEASKLFSKAKLKSKQPITFKTENSLKIMKNQSFQKINFRDWNPDIRWAIKRGYTVQYDTSSNEIICPDLKISSRTISSRQKLALRKKVSVFSSYSGSSSTGSGSSSSGTKTATTSSVSRTRAGNPGSGLNSGQTAAKDKK